MNKQSTPPRTVRELIAALGGTSAVAKLCDIEPPSVSEWIARNKIPHARQMYLAAIKPGIVARPEKKKSAA